MDILSYTFVMPRGYVEMNNDNYIEINASNGRTFMLLVPPGTRYGDVFRFKAGKFDFDINNALLFKGQ